MAAVRARRRWRLLVVLEPPPALGQEVDVLRRALGDRDTARIAPHLTLAPPVNVNDDDLAEALAVVRDAAAAVEPFDLELGPVTSFAPATPTIHLDVRGDVAAAGELYRLLRRPPLARPLVDGRSFVPHVTLTRQASPARIAAARLALDAYRAAWWVDRLVVMVEIPGGEGGPARVWRRLTDAWLDGRRIIGRGGLEIELTTSSSLDPPSEATLGVESSVLEAPEESPPAGEPPEPPPWGATGALVVTARHEGRVLAVAACPAEARAGDDDAPAWFEAESEEGRILGALDHCRSELRHRLARAAVR